MTSAGLAGAGEAAIASMTALGATAARRLRRPQQARRRSPAEE